jgi:hypothetical protein
MQSNFVVRLIINANARHDHPDAYDMQSIYISQNYPHSIGCMQQTLHLRTVLAITIAVRSLVIASLLTEEFLDVLDALRLLLILAHHAEGRREELLAVLHLNWK